MNALASLDNLRNALPAIMKGAAQEAITMLAGYVGREMDRRQVTDDYRSGKSGVALGSADRRNTGPRLRIASGRLVQSLMLNGNNKGEQIQTVTIVGDSVALRYGTKVPYAAIHEFGGTISHPGGTPYFMDEEGNIHFVRKENARPGMRRTKPHAITIPKRPFLAPAFEAFRSEGLTMIQDRVMTEVLSAWGGKA